MILFGSPTCGPCNMLKAWLKGQDIQYDYVDISTEAGREAAIQVGVRAVPTAVINNDVITGMPQIKEHLTND